MMDKFLQFCRFNLSNITAFKKLSIVIGNESCDLDSAVSTIVLSYIKYHELTKHHDDDDDDSEIFVLPVLNVFREDLHLRREIVFWFEKVLQFELDWLICRDEIDFDTINSSSGEISISLVDHNENKEIFRQFPNACLDEIIDHHQPSSPLTDQQQQCVQSKIQIDTSVGSCCSLIALRYFQSNIIKHKFSSSTTVKSSSETFDSQIALILYGPILLDTCCLSHQAGRFSAKDYEAINKLEDLMKHPADMEPSLYDRNEVYQRLMAAKSSLDGLCFEDLLRKDMKIVESIADNNLDVCISSITGILLTEMSLRDKLKELKTFCNQPPKTAVFSDQSRPRIFNALILMSFDDRIPNNLRRQLAIFCSNKHLMRTIATCIERSEQLSLELITALESLRIYNQNNLKASRKVVLPIISTILNGPGANNNNGAETKRNDPVTITNGETATTSNTSAPSSFIQQPDSYYGSFIDDSFVGEFVGDYTNNVDDQHHDENILVMDANGENLILMNPTVENSCLSQIEFDFESFGPESIMYAGNVSDQQQQVNNQTNDKNVENNENNSSVKNDDNNDITNDLLNQQQTDENNDNNDSNQIKENKDPNDNLDGKDAEQNVLMLKNNDNGIITQPIINVENQIEQNNNDETINNNKQQQQQQPQSSFNRNSTLTKSQRKKIQPQMNIKNLVLNSNIYSPPPLDQLETPPFVSRNVSLLINGNHNNDDDQLNDQQQNDDNNDSSQQQQTPPKIVLNDPLGVNKPMNDGNNLNPGSTSTLGRNQSKKKIEVNYSLFMKQQSDDKNQNPDAINLDSIINVKTQNDNDNISNNNNNNSQIDNQTGNQESNPSSSLKMNIIEFKSIDMQIIEPYKKVMSHVGQLSNGDCQIIGGSSSNVAVILFSACYLPERSRSDYHYVMDNLFLYVVNTLHNIIADDYILIYLNNDGTNQQQQQQSANNMPTFSWLKRCYQMIDRKLKKNLKGLYLVHPTFWLKTLIIMSKPFISSKFSKKLKFVRSMDELKRLIPINDSDIVNAI